ncbi:MAG: hypothetical protein RL748_2048 [Pseudomonadota bacterium]|jgi:3-phytase
MTMLPDLAASLSVAGLLLVASASGLATPASPTSPAPASTLPSSLDKAQELAPLPDGGWLALDKRGLTLYDAAGKKRTTLAMRAKQLDVRSDGPGVLAVVLDSDIQHAQSLQIDLATGRIGQPQALPQQTFALESLCLFRDQQQLNQLFVIGKDGQAEQWLLAGDAPRLIRKLALPPPCPTLPGR